jgi:hypothetical protein
MRKEILLAIFVGITLGLMITFGIYQNRENSQSNQNIASDELVSNQLASDSSDTQDSVLSISTPEDNLLTEQKSLIVSGTTSANSMVIIFVNNTEVVATSDAGGNFSKEVILDKGGNYLQIYALNENNQTVKKEKSVIYDPDLNTDQSQSASESARPQS